MPVLAATLCASGNMPDGGVVIVGLDERAEFTITGVKDPAAAIASQARQAQPTSASVLEG